MNSFNVKELVENTYFTHDLIIDKTFLLLTNSLPVTAELKNALIAWNFEEVFSEGEIVNEAVDEECVLNAPTADSINDVLNPPREIGLNEVAGSESNRLEAVQTVYNEYVNYITNLYTRYATHKELNLEKISATIKEFCIFVKENRRYVLRVQPQFDENDKRNFIVSHAMRSTVLAVTIGLQLRLPLTKLVELGVSCLLHEIGMLKLPPSLYLSDRTLTPSEKNTMLTHPVISYNILKSYDFPLSICLGALEHHEKENGLGYPRRLKKDQISMYAKIISVACSFEAITAPRKYKEAQSMHVAMVEMLKNTGNQYDETVIKALLYSLSLFPIGTFVYLTNGKIAQVTDVNPENPKNPIVQLLGEKDASGEPKTLQTSDTDVRILRVLEKKEAVDILRHIKK
ncbi:MAG: HD-GYP domain-containing protein [Treponema sp.]|nr:HD-GYP domain-containing protein [Treponema sp.]